MVCFILFIPGTILGFVAVFAALCRHDRLHHLQFTFDLAQLEQNINTLPDGPKKKRMEDILKALENEQ